MKGLAVLVLRFTHPGAREYRVPLNVKSREVEVPVGLGLITLVLLGIAIVNLFTKPDATVAGVTFSLALFTMFTISERHFNEETQRARTSNWINLISSREVISLRNPSARAQEMSWCPSAIIIRSIILPRCWIA